jgi:hypothetical protein
MPDTGYLLPVAGANVDNAGGVAWTNPEEATLDDGVDASMTVGAAASDYLAVTNFGATLPAGSAVVGIEASVVRVDDSSATVLISLTKNGTTPVGSTKTVTDVGDPVVVGGASDLWGTTLSEAEVEATGFGVLLWLDPTV